MPSRFKSSTSARCACPDGARCPRHYLDEDAALAAAKRLEAIGFFTKGHGYAYECDRCGAWHAGHDTGAQWHQGRCGCRDHLDYVGVHPDAEQADVA